MSKRPWGNQPRPETLGPDWELHPQTHSVRAGLADVFAFMNRLCVIDISNNLGDSKSLITHPASTTHRRLAPEVQAEMGITPSVLRLSVGLEHSNDLIKDLQQALAK